MYFESGSTAGLHTRTLTHTHKHTWHRHPGAHTGFASSDAELGLEKVSVSEQLALSEWEHEQAPLPSSPNRSDSSRARSNRDRALRPAASPSPPNSARRSPMNSARKAAADAADSLLHAVCIAPSPMEDHGGSPRVPCEYGCNTLESALEGSSLNSVHKASANVANPMPAACSA